MSAGERERARLAAPSVRSARAKEQGWIRRPLAWMKPDVSLLCAASAALGRSKDQSPTQRRCQGDEYASQAQIEGLVARIAPVALAQIHRLPAQFDRDAPVVLAHHDLAQRASQVCSIHDFQLATTALLVMPPWQHVKARDFRRCLLRRRFISAGRGHGHKAEDRR
jgi:hypothetical protein